MTKLIFIVFSLLIAYAGPASAQSSNKIFCATNNFYKHRSRVLNLKGDKIKHCTLSCLVARRCPAWEVEVVGILKEVLDFFGPGNAEQSDLEANRIGISFSPLSKKDEDCFRFCRQVY